MIQLTATILQLVVFIAYIWYIVKRFGVLESISDSTYNLEGSSRAWFLGFLGSIGILNLAQPMGMFGAIAMALLWFTGTTISHKSPNGYTRIIHIISAVGAISISFVGLFILHGLWIPSAIVVAIAPVIYLKDRSRFVWWVECVAFIALITTYFIL
jgi:hypothetical protein